MLQFNDRRPGERRSPASMDDGISFAVRYAPPGAARSARAVDCEKHFRTKSTALNFCVILRNLGGNPVEMVQLIHGQCDAVLDGRDLAEAIDRQRTRLENEAVPPWR